MGTRVDARGFRRRSTGQLIALIGALACTAVLVLPGVATASKAYVNVLGGVTVIGGDESSTISTDYGLGIVIADTAGIVADAGCTQSSATRVVCYPPASGSIAIEADLGGGNDTVGSLLVGHLSKVWGGPGNDRLIGDSFHNELYGEDGADYVWGGGDPDTIVGGPGSDQLFGDTIYAYEAADGNDTIDARDSVKDEVQCGGGIDGVVADRVDDVYVECENVDLPAGSPPPPPSDDAMLVMLDAPRHGKLSKLVKRGVRVTCDFLAAGQMEAKLISPPSTSRRLGWGRRKLTLSTVSGPVDDTGYWIRLRPKARYRRALRQARRATLVVRVKGWNDGGSDAETARIAFRR